MSTTVGETNGGTDEGYFSLYTVGETDDGYNRLHSINEDAVNKKKIIPLNLRVIQILLVITLTIFNIAFYLSFIFLYDNYNALIFLTGYLLIDLLWLIGYIKRSMMLSLTVAILNGFYVICIAWEVFLTFVDLVSEENSFSTYFIDTILPLIYCLLTVFFITSIHYVNKYYPPMKIGSRTL